MLKDQNPVAMWMPQTTREAYKHVGQQTGEDQYQVAQRLIAAEQKRLERKAQKGGGRG
jgi:hypothetical protein